MKPNRILSKSQGQITQAQIDFEPEIRALCWKNPFAAGMIAGKIETRNRPTNVRGFVLIVATEKRYNNEQLFQITTHSLYLKMMEKMAKTFGCDENYSNGKAVGIAKLTDCRPMTPEDEEKTFVKYQPGKWCWIFEDVTPIIPFKLKGFQGWRILKESIKRQILINEPGR